MNINEQINENENMQEKLKSEVFVRGQKHDTLVTFFICIGASFATPYILFASFFYWPLANKWLNYIGEFYWAWIFSLNKWFTVVIIIIVMASLILTMFMVGVVLAVLLFAFLRVCFNAYTQARKNREYYIAYIHYNDSI